MRWLSIAKNRLRRKCECVHASYLDMIRKETAKYRSLTVESREDFRGCIGAAQRHVADARNTTPSRVHSKHLEH